MNFKTTLPLASGRPNHDKGNHPPINSPLHLADVYRIFIERTQKGSCCRVAEVMNISHDSATRFLQREHYDGKDLYNESASLLNLKGGVKQL